MCCDLPECFPSGDPCDFSRQATAQKTDSTAYKGEVATSFCGLAGQGGIQVIFVRRRCRKLGCGFRHPPPMPSHALTKSGGARGGGFRRGCARAKCR